jgi:hypothetical protein
MLLPGLLQPPFTCWPYICAQPTLNSEVFRYMWQTHTDILGGLERLVAAYNQHLAGVYTYTLSVGGRAGVCTGSAFHP